MYYRTGNGETGSRSGRRGFSLDGQVAGLAVGSGELADPAIWPACRRREPRRAGGDRVLSRKSLAPLARSSHVRASGAFFCLTARWPGP